jgi:hypothetical protein
LRVGASLFSARTSMGLRSGEWYIMRPVKTGAELQLRVESHLPRPVGNAEVARGAGLPPGPLGEAVVRAFIRSGLGLDPARLQQVMRRVLSDEKDPLRSPERARTHAIALEKGLRADGEFMDAILGTLDGHTGAGGSGNRHNWKDGPGAEQAEESERLERAVRDAFSFSDSADHPLQLFNHIVGVGDHWIVVPVNVHGAPITATLRICVPRAFALGTDPASPPVREATLAVEAGAQRWLFGLVPDGDGFRARILAADDSDGFSLGWGEDIMSSVDSSA